MVREDPRKNPAAGLRQGHEEELQAFFEEFYPVFLLFSTHYVQNRHACEDIVLEAFMEYWQRRETFDSLVAVRAYIYKIIRNKCLNYLRHQQVVDKHEQYLQSRKEWGELESKDYLLEHIIREESRHTVNLSVTSLPPMAQKVVLMAMSGLTNDEIAEKLHISVNTVRNHKAKSYRLLRLKLSEIRTLFIAL